ncbi:50S ribosomal protein L22 [Ferroplasma sp.]|uniref:50S ribosomal protein L22 n=1 Tax=Ferroplasma sp. TaxID=2591003 RepID=UPI00307CFB72
MKGYSIDKMPEKHARAQVRETDISMKDAVNVAHFLKDMDLETAKNSLDLVMEKKIAVPYFRYLDSVSHRRATGPGRYPVKAIKAFKKLLDDVSANAEFKGLTDDLKIFHLSASKGRMIKKFLPKAYGRAGAFFKDLINLEVVVVENEKE